MSDTLTDELDLQSLYDSHPDIDWKQASIDEICFYRDAATPILQASVNKAKAIHTSDNPTLTTVLKNPELWREWQPAIDNEFNNWKPNERGVILSEVPISDTIGQNTLRIIVLFKKKYHPNGSFDKYKCRMAINGKNEHFPDKSTAYSPTLQGCTLMFLIAIAAFLGFAL